MNKANAIMRAITAEWKTCQQIADDSGVKEFLYVSTTVSRLCSNGYAERKFPIHCKPQYFRKKEAQR